MICRPKITARRLRGALVAAGLTLTVVPATVSSTLADDKLALNILAFVYSIEASPDWSARMRGLVIDEERATIEIGSLVVAAEDGGLVVEIEGATLAGYAATADGGISAASLTIKRGAITAGSTTAVLSDVGFDDVGFPAPAGIGYDRTRPFSSLIGAYSALAKSRISGGRIAAIDVDETHQDETSAITYRNVEFGALAEGRLENATAAPLAVTSPADGPLAELTVARAEAQGIDLDAFLAVADPLHYITGRGDKMWREAVDLISYTDLTLTLPTVRLTLASIAMEGLKLRQPSESFAPLIDAMTSDRRRSRAAMKLLRSRYLGGLLSAFGVARFAVDDLVITAAGIDQLTLGAFDFRDASSDGFGEIAVEDFVAAITGRGAVQVGHFALGDVVLPPFEAFDDALEQAESGGNVDISSLAPKLNSIEATAIHMQAIDFPGLALGRLRVELDNHIGTVPTSVSAEIDNLDVATTSLPSDRLRSLIAGLGYDKIGVDAKLNLDWHEDDGTVRLDEFELDIADFGNTTADLVLAGLTREAIERGDDAAALNDLQFERARLTFEDKSVVERSLAMRAELLNIPLERLKQQLAGALPLMLAVLGEQAKAIVPVLQEFIKTPGTLTIEAAPEAPVPVSEIETAVRTRPQSLPSLLAISVTGAPSGEPAGPEADKQRAVGGESGQADVPVDEGEIAAPR